MTNEEFITKKKRAKFNLIWNSLINKLPKSSQMPLEKNDCRFNTQLSHKEQYIVCRRNDRPVVKIYMNKNELKQIYLDYHAYLTEIREYKIRAKDRIDNGLEVFSDQDRLERTLSKEIRRFVNEKKYAETLIRIGGSSIKSENEIDKLLLYQIGDYVKENRAEKKFNNIYFEFKEYGNKKISQLVKRKHKVQDILIEQKVSQFAEFCNKQKIADIYDLILIPYYCKSLVSEFGADCLQAVINSIKTFIDLQIQHL